MSAIFTPNEGDKISAIRKEWHDVRYGGAPIWPEAELLEFMNPADADADRLYGDAARILEIWEASGPEAAAEATVSIVNRGADEAYKLVTQFINVSAFTSRLYELVTGTSVGELLRTIQAE